MVSPIHEAVVRKYEIRSLHHRVGSSHRTHSRSLLPSSMVEQHTPPAVPVLVQVPTTPSMIQEHTLPVRISQKRIHYSKDEHRVFLEGINKFSKGEWISISKYLFPSKTPSQITTHAQKCFIRQATCTARKKRKNIHDILTSDHVVVPYGFDSQSCLPWYIVTQQQQQTFDHAVALYDGDCQNCLPCDIATQHQQGLQQEEQAAAPQIDLNRPSTSNNFLSSQHRKNGRGISDINIEEEVGESQLMHYFNTIPPLSDSELEDNQFSLLLNDLLADLHSTPPTTTNKNNLPHYQIDDACGGISDK
ncbi:hypothetical protein RIF29_20446 [Crotalaria pallida]|uniref:Myb-like domain-containing protein n=1 Tax=Crotalaria pallida TaxID=3830 RepID=A0AAN9F143_CROPI